MNDNELMNIWKSHDQKLEKILVLNKTLVYDVTKAKVGQILGGMRGVKKVFLIMAIPYTALLYLLTFLGFQANAFFVTFGFGSIGFIMSAMIIGYIYHLQLINSVDRVYDVVTVQKKIADLKISSFNMVRLSIVQIPFWSICWISLEALKTSPILYGGINLIVLIVLIYLTHWLYNNLDPKNPKSKVAKVFLSGAEWEPIEKASAILDQLKDLKE
jgi:hypothetical protein